MASERAIVDGFCGWISVSPVLTAVEIGEQPVASAPKKRNVLGSTRPSVISSSNAFLIFVISEPPAMGTTMLSGRRQPSCSAISKTVGFEIAEQLGDFKADGL